MKRSNPIFRLDRTRINWTELKSELVARGVLAGINPPIGKDRDERKKPDHR